MKNFRKVLALVLVVATLFSFASMASAAKVEYTDAEAFVYDDAVEVLSAIGILNGYAVGDGYEFRPGDPIDRDETAKMIAVLSNAGDDVSTLYAGANTFADVAATHWAASYIAYCVQTGIVAGRNASTFDPDANVTGFEVAKMLLCVMGFDAQSQGYIGANWKVNVLRDAKNFGLLDNLNSKFDMSKAATREEVAQMMLNTLAAPVVIGTLSDETIKISNSLYMNLTQNGLEELYWELKDANMSEDYAVVYGNVIVAVNTLVGHMYKGLGSVEAVDKFGRPGVAWVYENAKGHDEFVKFYPYPSDHYYTQRATLNVDLSDEINSRWPYQIVMFVNGEMWDDDTDIGAGDKDAEDKDVSDYGTTEWDEDKGKWVLTEDFEDAINEITGKGVETFVYVDDVHRQIVVSVVNTYIDAVEVNDRSRKNRKFDLAGFDGLKMSVFGSYKDGDVVLYRVGDENEYRELPEELVEDTVSVNGKNRDVYRVNYAGVDYDEAIVDVAKAEVEVIKVKKTFDNHKTDNEFDKATITDYDGKTYSYAHNVNTTILGTQGNPMNANHVKQEWAVYFDQFGYIMFWTEPEYDLEYDVAYFVENGWRFKYSGESSYEDNGMTYYNKFVDFDAKKGELEMDEEFFEYVSNLTEFSNGRVIAYRYDEAEEEFVGFVAETSENNINTATGEIVDGVWATTETKILVRTFDYAKCEYEYEAFEGYKELRKAYPGAICVETPDGVGAKPATVQWFPAYDAETDEVDEEFASYVFIDAAYAAAADQSFFVLGYEGTVANSDLIPDLDNGYLVQQFRYYDIYKALVGGEEGYVLVTNPADYDELLEMGKYAEFLQVLGVAEDGKPLYLVSNDNEDFELVEEDIITDVEYIRGDRVKCTYNGSTVMMSLADDAEIVVIYTEGGEYDSHEVYDDADEFNDDRYFEMGDILKAYVEFSDERGAEDDVARLILMVD